MNNLVNISSSKAIKQIRAIVGKVKFGPDDIQAITEMLDQSPMLLNSLSMEELSKISKVGVDISRYLSPVHVNNIKTFVVLYTSDSMSRLARLVKTMERLETKYYDTLLSSQYMNPKTALAMIDQIQTSITASVSLMLKLTESETLMNLFVVNLNNINDEISTNRNLGYTSTTQILSLDSRKKIERMTTLFIDALNAETPTEEVIVENVIDAEFKES